MVSSIANAVCEIAVCRGGLLQYPENPTHKLPLGYLYMSQPEELDPKHHPDSGEWFVTNADKRRRHKQTKKAWGIKPIKSNVQYWLEGSTKTAIVPDRLNLLLRHNVEGEITTQELFTDWVVGTEDHVPITFDLYHSVKELKEHGPVKNDDGKVRGELVKWPVAFSRLPDLAALGFSRFPHESGDAYHLKGFVRAKATLKQMQLTLVLFRAGLSWKESENGDCEYLQAKTLTTLLTTVPSHSAE